MKLIETSGPGGLTPHAWAETAIARIETTTDDQERILIRDEALRVVAWATAVGDRNAEKMAAEVVWRVNRAIGEKHKDRQKPPGVATGDRASGRTIPKTTVRDYRADQEALTPGGFDRLAETVRDTESAPSLNRSLIRRAGAIEHSGGDPAEAVRNTGTPLKGRSGEHAPEWFTPPEIIGVAREIMGGIDLDPASCAEAQETVRAGQFFSVHGEVQPWPSGARVFLNPPYCQPDIANFARRAVDHDGPTIVLSNNQTECKWGQALWSAADAVCLIAGRVRFHAPGGEIPRGPLQGQLLTGLRIDVGRFKAVAGELGVVYVAA